MNKLFLVLTLVSSSCMATWTAHEHLVKSPDPPGAVNPRSRSIAEKTTFVVLLPALVAVDIVTAPLQMVYIISKLPDAH